MEVRLQYWGKQWDFAFKNNPPWAIIDLKESYLNSFKGNRASNFQKKINTNYVTLLLALMKGLEAVMWRGSSDILQGQNCIMLYKRIMKNCWKWVFQDVLPTIVVILWKAPLARREHLRPWRFQGKPKNLHCSSQRPSAVLLCLTEQKQTKLYLTTHC